MPTVIPRRHLAVVAIGVLVAACGAPVTTPAPRSPSTVPGSSAPATPEPASPSPSASAVRVERAAPMLHARTGFDSVVLGDGSVLAVGDDFACFPGPALPGSERAERYDPATDTWTEAESLNKPRKSFATVRTADGRALVMGGVNPEEDLYSSTKLFDPATGRWTDGPLLEIARGDPIAATIVDGRVIIGSVRFVGETDSVTTTEILHPDAASWITGPPIEGMAAFTFVPLTDGGLMAVGGAFETEDVFVVFDPDGGVWEPIDGPSILRHVRLAALADGDVLAFGFEDLAIGRSPTVRVERFDGATGEWSEAAPMGTPREGAMVTRLADGRVFVAGGATSDETDPEAHALATTEIYDPVANVWTEGPDLLEPRKDGGALVLDDGSVLIHGGDASFNINGDVPWCPEPLTSTERVYVGS